PDRLAELRRIAEAATPGPWEWRMSKDGRILDLITLETGYNEEIITPSHVSAWLQVNRGLKDYIPTFDPQTVLALLDEIERLRRERDAALDVLGREDIGGGDRGWPTRESERARLVAEVGECCLGADPLCAAGCLVEAAL